jgi:hypothetical protein
MDDTKSVYRRRDGQIRQHFFGNPLVEGANQRAMESVDRGLNHLWRKNLPRNLSISLVADERGSAG